MSGQCDLSSLLSSSPTQAILADGTTVAQYVFGRGKPAGGLYCPGGPVTPCMAGHFCPNTTTQTLCPSGHFCPPQSTAPLACSWTSSCPAGSVQPGLAWPKFVGLVALVLAVWAGWLLLATWVSRQRRQHAKRQLQQAHAQHSAWPAVGEGAGSAQQWTGLRRAQPPVSLQLNDLRWQPAPAAPPIQGLTAVFPHSCVHGILGVRADRTSSILAFLSGQLPGKTAHGSVLYNGAAHAPSTFKQVTGYVAAEYALHKSLTVRQNLQYAARLQAPAKWSRQRCTASVDDVIGLLQLQHIQHCLVSTLQAAGMHGRASCQRISIAMELVASPSILLIDQRFCLLGQRDAAALMAALGAAAHDLGLNVILGAEHMQPTIFSALDSVALLDAEGQAAFQGPPSNVLPFLRGLGLMPSAEQAQDIPSFCLDAITGHVSSTAASGSGYHTFTGQPADGMPTSSGLNCPHLQHGGLALCRQFDQHGEQHGVRPSTGSDTRLPASGDGSCTRSASSNCAMGSHEAGRDCRQPHMSTLPRVQSQAGGLGQPGMQSVEYHQPADDAYVQPCRALSQLSATAAAPLGCLGLTRVSSSMLHEPGPASERLPPAVGQATATRPLACLPTPGDAVRAASGMDQELSTPPSSLGSRSSVAELVPDWNQPMQTSANSMTDITCRTGSGQPDAVHGARKAVAAANPGDGHASGLDSGAEPSLHPCMALSPGSSQPAEQKMRSDLHLLRGGTAVQVSAELPALLAEAAQHSSAALMERNAGRPAPVKASRLRSPQPTLDIVVEGQLTAARCHAASQPGSAGCTLEADQPGVAPRGFLGSEGQPALQEARQEQNFQLESATAAVPGDVDQATGSTAIEPATTQAAAPPSPARQCRAVDRETGDAGIRANSHEGVQRSSSGPASSAATSQAASSDPLADWYLPLQPTLPAGRSPAAPCDPVTAQNKDAKTPDSAAGEVYSGSAAAGDAGHKSRDADLPNAQASGMMAAATSKDSLHADVPRTEHTALTAENTGQGLRQAAVGQGRPARPQLSSPPSSVGSPRSSPAQELISDWRAPTRRKAGHSSRRLPQSLAAAALGRNAMPAGAVGVQGDDESSDTSLQARSACSPAGSATGMMSELLVELNSSSSSSNSSACGVAAAETAHSRAKHSAFCVHNAADVEEQLTNALADEQPSEQQPPPQLKGQPQTVPKVDMQAVEAASEPCTRQQAETGAPVRWVPGMAMLTQADSAHDDEAHAEAANQPIDQPVSELQGVETDPQRDVSFSTQQSSGSVYTDGRMSPYSDADLSPGKLPRLASVHQELHHAAVANPLFLGTSPGKGGSQAAMPSATDIQHAQQPQRTQRDGPSAACGSLPQTDTAMDSLVLPADQCGASSAPASTLCSSYGWNPLFRSGAALAVPHLSQLTAEALLTASPAVPQPQHPQLVSLVDCEGGAALSLRGQVAIGVDERRRTASAEADDHKVGSQPEGIEPPIEMNKPAASALSAAAQSKPTDAPRHRPLEPRQQPPAADAAAAGAAWESTVSIVARQLEGVPEAWPALDDVVPDLGSESIKEALEEKLSPGADPEGPAAANLTWATRVLEWRAGSTHSRPTSAASAQQRAASRSDQSNGPVAGHLPGQQPVKRKLYSSMHSPAQQREPAAQSAAAGLAAHGHEQDASKLCVSEEGSMSSLLCQVLSGSPAASVCSTPSSARPRKQRAPRTPRSSGQPKAPWQSPGPIKTPLWQITGNGEASPGNQPSSARTVRSRPPSPRTSPTRQPVSGQTGRSRPPSPHTATPHQPAGMPTGRSRPPSPSTVSASMQSQPPPAHKQNLQQRQQQSPPLRRGQNTRTADTQNAPQLIVMLGSSAGSSPKSASPVKQPPSPTRLATTFGGSRYANQGSGLNFDAIAAAHNPFLFHAEGPGPVAEAAEEAGPVAGPDAISGSHQLPLRAAQHSRPTSGQSMGRVMQPAQCGGFWGYNGAGPVSEATEETGLQLLSGGSWSSSRSSGRPEAPRDVETGDADIPASGGLADQQSTAGMSWQLAGVSHWWRWLMGSNGASFSNPMLAAGAENSPACSASTSDMAAQSGLMSAASGPLQTITNPLCDAHHWQASQLRTQQQPDPAADATGSQGSNLSGGQCQGQSDHASSSGAAADCGQPGQQQAAVRRRNTAAAQICIVAQHAALSSWHQAVSWKLLDLVATITAAFLLGLVHGIDAGMHAVPEHALAAMLTLGTISTAFALPQFGGGRLTFPQQRAGGLRPFSYLLGTVAIHAADVVVRPAMFLAVYASAALPGVPFRLYYVVGLSVVAWSSGLGALLAVALRPGLALTAAMAIPVAIVAVANGVSPTLPMLGTGPVYLLTGLSYLRWAIEAITIGTLNSTPAYLRPVLLHASARQGFCGLHHIFRWDQGEWISDAQAQQLLHLLGSGGAMCQQFVQHDIIALLAQAALMYLVVLLALYGIRRSQRF